MPRVQGPETTRSARSSSGSVVQRGALHAETLSNASRARAEKQYVEPGAVVKTAMRRLKDTLAPLGLHLARVRGAGYLLDRAD